MKHCLLKIFVLTGLCIGLLAAPADYSAARCSGRTVVWNGLRTTVRGSGNLTASTKTLPDFHAVSASRGVEVIIGGTDKVVIEADDNVLEYVVAEVENGILGITISDEVSLRNANVTVRIPNNGKIEALHASSGAEIRTESALKASDLDLRLSSAAALIAALKAERCTIRLASGAVMKAAVDFGTCDIRLSSGSGARLAGRADSMDAALSSGSELNAFELETRTCEVAVSSGAEAEVNCSGALTAWVSSGASVEYKGDCSVDKQVGSGGTVRKR